MKPSVGDRFTRPGHPDVVVASVSGTFITFTNAHGTHTVPLSKFLELRANTVTHTEMIVREIIKDPTLIDCFDWFNDYKDTRLFISERGDEALLEKFDTKYSEWCHQKSQTMSTPSSGSHNTHARLSPSSAKSWSNCTASISYIEANADRIPKDNSSAYSQEGTEAHDHAADVLLGKKTIDQIPEDFRPYVAAYVDHCLSLAPDGVVPQIESQVPLWYQADQNGTVDFAVVTEDRVTIRDLKYGAGVLVTAQENPQLAIYAYSLIRMLDPVYEFTPETVVDIGIFQPRHREADTSVPWIITLKELAEFCREIEYAVIQVQTGRGLKFAPSEGDDGACRWCKAKGICEARHAAISEALVVPDSGVTREEMVMSMPDLTKDEKKLPPLDRVAARLGKLGVPEGAITEKYLVGLFAAKKSMESLLDDVAEYLSARAMEGNIPEGTKLVLGRAGNRAWVNEEAADTFLKNQGLKQDERYDFKVKSPTAAEEILKDKLKSSKRTATRFAELVSRSEPKKTLALASDKREACLPDVAVMPDLVALDDFEV